MASNNKGKEASGSNSSGSSGGEFHRFSLSALLLSGSFHRRNKNRRTPCVLTMYDNGSDGASTEKTNMDAAGNTSTATTKKSNIRRCGGLSSFTSRKSLRSKAALMRKNDSNVSSQNDVNSSTYSELGTKDLPNASNQWSVGNAAQSHPSAAYDLHYTALLTQQHGSPSGNATPVGTHKNSSSKDHSHSNVISPTSSSSSSSKNNTSPSSVAPGQVIPSSSISNTSTPCSASLFNRSNSSSSSSSSGGSCSASTSGCSTAEGGNKCQKENDSVSGANSSSSDVLRECVLCLQDVPASHFPKISTCSHSACLSCFKQYLAMEISESRVYITCPKCPELMHPTDIHRILNNRDLSYKFEDFMLRRVLSTDPDTRWCPAPDCGYAVIATGCAGCPKLKCERPGCASYFCYHCKADWHPNQTCDMARVQRTPHFPYLATSIHNDDDVKACPRCQVLIVKMDDGSCNHMTCSVCGAEFCWLCMKEVSDLHYLSPSGCTFWGKKPWSRKKKVLWQLGTLVGAPLGIALLAGLAVPAIITGVPTWIGRKIHSKYSSAGRHKRNMMVVCGVVLSSLASPVLAVVAVSIGVPILLAYVYGVVPISLCRSGGCGVITSAAGVRIAFDDEAEPSNGGGATPTSGVVVRAAATPAVGAASAIFGASGAAAISRLSKLGESSGVSSSNNGGSGSVLPTGGRIGTLSSAVSGSVDSCEAVSVIGGRCSVEPDRESASNVAIAPPSLAGSIASSSCFMSRSAKLEVPVEVEGENEALPAETLSLAVSERSTNTLDTENASTRALAHYKIDENSEVVSFSHVANAGDSASTVLEAVGGDSVSTIGACAASSIDEEGNLTDPRAGGVSILSSISATTTTNLYCPSPSFSRSNNGEGSSSDGADSKDSRRDCRGGMYCKDNEDEGASDGEVLENEYASASEAGGNNSTRHMNGSDPRLDSVSAIITARKLSAHAKGVTFSIGSASSRSQSRDHISLTLDDNISESAASIMSGASNSGLSAAAASSVSEQPAYSCRGLQNCGSVSRNIVMASDDECCADGCCYNETDSLVGGVGSNHKSICSDHIERHCGSSGRSSQSSGPHLDYREVYGTGHYDEKPTANTSSQSRQNFSQCRTNVSFEMPLGNTQSPSPVGNNMLNGAVYRSEGCSLHHIDETNTSGTRSASSKQASVFHDKKTDDGTSDCLPLRAESLSVLEVQRW